MNEKFFKILPLLGIAFVVLLMFITSKPKPETAAENDQNILVGTGPQNVATTSPDVSSLFLPQTT